MGETLYDLLNRAINKAIEHRDFSEKDCDTLVNLVQIFIDKGIKDINELETLKESDMEYQVYAFNIGKVEETNDLDIAIDVFNSYSEKNIVVQLFNSKELMAESYGQDKIIDNSNEVTVVSNKLQKNMKKSTIFDNRTSEVVGMLVTTYDFVKIYGHAPTTQEWKRFILDLDNILYEMCSGYNNVLKKLEETK